VEFGIKVGLLLMVPAALGLSVLAEPLVRLVYERNAFTGLDTVRTYQAFLHYAPQLPFVAIDQLMIYAFYARRDTVTPVLIGVLGVGFYLLVALPARESLDVNRLALANTVQNSLHGLILLGLLWRRLGSFSARDLLWFSTRVLLAAGIMAAVLWGVGVGVGARLGGSTLLLAGVLALEVALGLVIYSAGVLVLRIPEAQQLWRELAARVWRR
jgi:putative peptidoglycan lipid II flippase